MTLALTHRAAFLTFLGLAGLALSPAPAEAQPGEAAVLTVEVARPAERQWPDTIPASGWLKPWHEAVIASEIGGLRVTEVLADVGTVVTRGQPVARLADEAVRADLRKEEAALAIARTDLAKARMNADRARKVQGSGALSDEKISEYLMAEQTAVAAAESAEALLESQRIRLAQTTIRAADDGLISARAIQLGAVVGSGTELFRLVRQRRVEWQAEVSARHLARIRDGLAATIFGPGNQRLKGTVRLVGPAISPDTGRAIVTVALLGSDTPPIGLHLTGQIELETRMALAVPETALVLRDGLSYVFTVGADRRVTRVRVETGRREGREVEIRGGLAASANIVRSGGAFLTDGALVRVEGDIR